MDDEPGTMSDTSTATVQAVQVQDPSPTVYRPSSIVHRPLTVAVVAVLGYLFILSAFLYETGDPRDLVLIGRKFLVRSNASATIKIDPDYTYNDATGGYDGQFAYFIALDPANARYYVDNDSYRYMRILYPMAARMLAGGRPEWTAWALLIVNLLSVGAGTWAIAAWCRWRHLSPWLALVYAFYAGQVIAVTRDLNEPLAFALVAGAVYIFARYPQHRLWAGLLFGLAGLARETTLVFPALYALWLLVWGDQSPGARLRSVAPVLGMAFGPFVAWQAYLTLWLGAPGISRGDGLFGVPLANLTRLYPFTGEAQDVVQAVVLPSIIALVATVGLAVREKRARWQAEVWILAANVLLFVLLVHPNSLVEIHAAGRIAMPVVMGAIYVLPLFDRRTWFYICAGMWVVQSVTYVLNPAYRMLDGIF